VQYFRLDPSGSDGLEQIVKFLFLLPIPTMFVGGPACLYGILNNAPFLRFFKTGNTELNIAFASSVAIGFLLDFYIVLLMCYVILHQTNSTFQWFARIKCSWSHPNISKYQKYRLRMFYRMHQIHHKIATESADPLLPVIIPMGEMLLITTTFTLIRFHNSFIPAILVPFFFVGILAGEMLMLAIQLAVNLTNCSQQFIDLGSKFSTHFSKADKKFFKSCQPLKWKIGGSFTIVKDTFIKIMNDVVINGVINLLLV